MRQFLALLSSEALILLEDVFDEKKGDEAALLTLIRELQVMPPESDTKLSDDTKDLALLRMVIEKGGISSTPFIGWASFETFFIELLTGNILQAAFFKEVDLNTVRQFFALLSSEALIFT